MVATEGFIFHFNEPERGEQLRKAIANGKGSFTDALSVADWKPKEKQLALLSFTGETIDYFGIAERGNHVVTGKSRVEFRELLRLSKHPISEFEVRLGKTLRQYFMRSASGVGGRIPEKTWEQCLEVLKELEPANQREIERIINLASLSGTLYSGPDEGQLMLERDALGSALDTFSGSNKLRKDVLGAWAPPQGYADGLENSNELFIRPSPSPNFLDNIPQRYLQEETALQHDLTNWPETISNHVHGISTFKQGDRTLKIVYANRNSLERQLGVDLIYYNAYYRLFALVQYKLMSPIGNEPNQKFGYRPDDQFEKELQRMNDFSKEFGKSDNLRSQEDFRLNSDGFFFKFVPNQSFTVGSDELCAGIYIPREYMNLLLDSDDVKGPNNGTLIHSNNARRHLSNSDFVNGINKGWLGTNGTTSEKVQEIVTAYLETGRALIIATEQRW